MEKRKVGFYLWILLTFILTEIFTTLGAKADTFHRHPDWEVFGGCASPAIACSAGCTGQAINSKACSVNECSAKYLQENTKSFPNQPEAVRAVPYFSDAAHRHKLEWIPPQDILGSNIGLKAFKVIATRTDNESHPQETTCRIITFGDSLSAQSRFENCVEGGNYYHEIHSLPERNSETDYVHRIVTVCNSSHDINNTFQWCPKLMEIHNDSCSKAVTVTFNLAPQQYNIKTYKVTLFSLHGSKDEKYEVVDSNSNIFLANNQPKAVITFENVPDSRYNIRIFPETKKKVCKKKNKNEYCAFTMSKPFEISSSHKKCTTVQELTEPLISKATMCILLGTALVSTVFVVFSCVSLFTIKKNRRKSKQNIEMGDVDESVSVSDGDTTEKEDSFHYHKNVSEASLILPSITDTQDQVPEIVPAVPAFEHLLESCDSTYNPKTTDYHLVCKKSTLPVAFNKRLNGHDPGQKLAMALQ